MNYHIEKIRQGLSIIQKGDDSNGRIQYEAGSPTELNTIIEGATLEFKYTVYAKNISEDNYLSADLMQDYSKADYSNTLKTKYRLAKANIAKVNPANYTTGDFLGSYYYTGVHTDEQDAKLAVTYIKDYINNDLDLKAATENVDRKLGVYEKHYVLNADYTLGSKEIVNLLEYKPDAKENAIQLTNTQQYEQLYSVSVTTANAISATGKKEFDNYIAEIMEYTNAAGRRAKVTPGNAEIVDHEYRSGKSHESDEADSLRVQLGVATGEDKQTPYTWATIVVASVAIIGIGAFSVKKYIVKK